MRQPRSWLFYTTSLLHAPFMRNEKIIYHETIYKNNNKPAISKCASLVLPKRWERCRLPSWCPKQVLFQADDAVWANSPSGELTAWLSQTAFWRSTLSLAPSFPFQLFVGRFFRDRRKKQQQAGTAGLFPYRIRHCLESEASIETTTLSAIHRKVAQRFAQKKAFNIK